MHITKAKENLFKILMFIFFININVLFSMDNEEQIFSCAPAQNAKRFPLFHNEKYKNNSEEIEQVALISMENKFYRKPIIQMADDHQLGSNADNIFLKYVLGIDGGGIRGAYPAENLFFIHQQIEKFVNKDMKNQKNFKHLFQIFQGGISGTSTGAIIAAALATPYHRQLKSNDDKWMHGPYTISDIRELYKNLSKEIFKKRKSCKFCCLCILQKSCFKYCFGCCGPKYSNEPLKKELEKYFGDIRLGETVVPVQITAFDASKGKPIFFDSFSHPAFKLVDVLLASAAAPTYLPHHSIDKVNYIDGGMCNNKPAVSALVLGVKYLKKLDNDRTPELGDFTLVSCGTGTEPTKMNEAQLKQGMVKNAETVIVNLFEGQSEADHQNINALYEAYCFKDKYFRFQTVLDEDSLKLGMDNPEILKPLVKRAKNEQEGSMNRILKELENIQEEELKYLNGNFIDDSHQDIKNAIKNLDEDNLDEIIQYYKKKALRLLKK